jgi:transposase
MKVEETRHHKSNDYKKCAVEHYLTLGKTQEDTCKIFKCSVRSLMRWVNRYKDKGYVNRVNRSPISYKVKKEHVKFILDILKKNKTITMEDLLHIVKEKFEDIELSRRHLSRIVKQNHVSLKLTNIRHQPIKRFGKDIDINKNLKVFYDEIFQPQTYFITLYILLYTICFIISNETNLINLSEEVF